MFHNGELISFGAFYRSPSGGSLSSFKSLSHTTLSLNSNFLLDGDFNMPNKQWTNNSPVLTGRSALSLEFITMIATNGFYKFVDFPTRRAGDSTSTLDFFFFQFHLSYRFLSQNI